MSGNVLESGARRQYSGEVEITADGNTGVAGTDCGIREII